MTVGYAPHKGVQMIFAPARFLGGHEGAVFLVVRSFYRGSRMYRRVMESH